MKNRGFTLVELLAVLVLVAALALIAVPSIINYVNKSKEQISEATEKLIFTGASLYADNNIDKFSDDKYNEYCISLADIVNNNYLSAPIIDSVSGEEIDLSKFVKIYYSYDFKLSIYRKNYELVDSCSSKRYSCVVANYIDEDKKIDVGVEIECGTESFYVIPDHEIAPDGTVSLLAKYNLNTDTNLQSEDNDSVEVFSTSSYWSTSTYPYWAYGEESNLYQYVDAYEKKLKNFGVNDVIATLMSYEQAYSLGCVNGDSCPSDKSWMYSTRNYWLGSVDSNYSNDAWHIHNGGSFCGGTEPDTAYGVRPVIIIPENYINNN